MGMDQTCVCIYSICSTGRTHFGGSISLNYIHPNNSLDKLFSLFLKSTGCTTDGPLRKTTWRDPDLNHLPFLGP